MIIYDNIKIPEEVAYAFIVGFIHKTPDKSNLTNQKISEISERIGFLCPNISKYSRKKIRQAIFNEPEIRSSIHEWNSMIGEFVDERYLILQGTRESIPRYVRVTEEMKFGFFLGIAIWYSGPEEEWKEKRSRFLSKISKTICKNIDRERLLDIRWYFKHAENIHELCDMIGRKACGKIEWTPDFYEEKGSLDDEEIMLRNFQEKYR